MALSFELTPHRRTETEIPGSSDVVEGGADGLDRFSLALTTLGYQVRAIGCRRIHHHLIGACA